jgi:hypothetical protein
MPVQHKENDPTAATVALSQDELKAYHRDGYIVPRWRFQSGDVTRMLDAVDRVLASNPEHRPEQLVCPHIPGGATKPIAGDHCDGFLGFGTAPGLRGILRQLVGENILMWGSQLFCKPPSIGMAIPWHQDGEYWPIRPLANVSAWIAIDAATRENGCLRIIPGSHKRGLQPHVLDESENVALDQTVAPEHLDVERAVDLELEPGQVALFDVHLMHGSNANTSGKRRAGLVYRYMPSTSLFDRSRPDTTNTSGHHVIYQKRPIYQVLGTDPGANTLVRGVA